jgi:hypothetical protein
MSQENLDIVTRALNAAFARPKPDFTTVNELYAPDQIRCGGRVPPQFAVATEGRLRIGSWIEPANGLRDLRSLLDH